MDPRETDETTSDLIGWMRPQLDAAKRRLETLNAQATDVIKAHPAACLVGALALGYVVARVARRLP